MNAQQILLIKKTWTIFQKIDPVLIGEVFYEKLFTLQPSFQRMFHTSRQVQSKKLIDMLSTIVNRIDALEALTTELKQLAWRHVNYGVKPEYYHSVGIALMWTLEQGLGNDWNQDVSEAWKACYHSIAASMIEATQPAC